MGPISPMGPMGPIRLAFCGLMTGGGLAGLVDDTAGGQVQQRAHGALVVNDGVAFDYCEWANDSVATNPDSEINRCLCRVLNRDTLQHQVLQNRFLDAGAGVRQLDSRVDPQRLFQGQAAAGVYGLSAIHQNARTIRQVVLRLAVVGPQLLQ